MLRGWRIGEWRHYHSDVYCVGCPGCAAELNLANFAAQDAAKLTGVRFAPTQTDFGPPGNTSETHVLRIVITNRFNATANPAGNYVFALWTGGYIQAGGSLASTQYDYVKLEGKVRTHWF